MTDTESVSHEQYTYVFRDCEEDDCIVLEQWVTERMDVAGAEPLYDFHLPRPAFTALQLWLREHE